MATAAAMDLSEYENDPRLFLFTSLTAGSSHVITATSRMETILKANRIPFQAIDLATDEKARRLWQRRGQKKKLPGLVKDGFVLGDLEEVEEWNEFGELKENIGPVPASNAAPAGSSIQGVSTAPPIGHNVPVSSTLPVHTLTRPIPPPSAEEGRIALPGAAEIAAMSKAKKEKEAAAKAASSTNAAEATTAGPIPETMTSAPAAKEASIESAKEVTLDKPLPDAPSETTATADTAATTKDIANEPPKVSTATDTSPEAASSAVLSPQNSKDDAALPPSEQVSTEKLTHRGSEVKEATPEEIKKLEAANTLHEAEGEEEGAETAAVQPAATTSAEAKTEEETTQDQEAKEGQDAAKSVED